MANFKSKTGIFLLIFSLIFLIFGIKFNLTGNVILEYFNGKSLVLRVVGFILLFISILMLTGRRSLDAVIIPTGDLYERNIRRTKRGVEEKAKYYLISGYLDKDKPIKESQITDIYTELRKYGIKPSEIKIENKSKNTLENAIYSLNKLKGLKRIGIVSYPEHLKRFEYIINKAKKEGLVDEDIKIIKIPTKQTLKEGIYGVLGNIKEKYKLKGGIKRAQENKIGWFGKLIKKVLD